MSTTPTYPRAFACWYPEHVRDIVTITAKSHNDAAISFVHVDLAKRREHWNAPDPDTVGVVDLADGETRFVSVRIEATVVDWHVRSESPQLDDAGPKRVAEGDDRLSIDAKRSHADMSAADRPDVERHDPPAHDDRWFLDKDGSHVLNFAGLGPRETASAILERALGMDIKVWNDSFSFDLPPDLEHPQAWAIDSMVDLGTGSSPERNRPGFYLWSSQRAVLLRVDVMCEPFVGLMTVDRVWVRPATDDDAGRVGPSSKETTP